MVGTIFNENEFLCYLQLKYLKLREYRETLLGYLNYFRSIEKRINLDMKHVKEFDKNLFDNLTEHTVKMNISAVIDAHSQMKSKLSRK
jgi:hypothetical protein